MVQSAKEIFRPFRERVNALSKEPYAEVKKPLRELLDVAQEVVAYGDRSYRRMEEEPGAGDALESQIFLIAKDLQAIVTFQEGRVGKANGIVKKIEVLAGDPAPPELEALVGEINRAARGAFVRHLKERADRVETLCEQLPRPDPDMPFAKLQDHVIADAGLDLQKETATLLAFHAGAEGHLDHMRNTLKDVKGYIAGSFSAGGTSPEDLWGALYSSAKAIGILANGIVEEKMPPLDGSYSNTAENIRRTMGSIGAPFQKHLDNIKASFVREIWGCVADLARDIQHYCGQTQKGAEEKIEPPSWVAGAGVKLIGDNRPRGRGADMA